MTDKSLVLELPADLLDRAQAAKLDLRQVLIDALEQKLPQSDDGIRPSLEEVEANIRESLEFVAHADPSELRVLGLHADDKSWFSEDWDDPLPDEYWNSDNP